MAAVQTIPPQFIITFLPGGATTVQKVASGAISGVTLVPVTSTTNDIKPVHEVLDAEFQAQIAQELNS